MKTIGASFDEPPVSSERGARLTNSVGKKNSERDYLIDGITVDLPVEVADASMLMNGFLVDAGVAQAMIQDSGFRVVELLPGRAMLQLLAVDYRDNELGDYNEAAIIFPVLTPGEKKPFPILGSMGRLARGRVANYVYRMPVDQEFTTHAGRFIWGFPKWVSHIDIDFNDRSASATFSDEDELVFSISAKAGGKVAVKQQRAATLAIRDGRAWKTYGTTAGSGLRFALGGESPNIGDSHPLAKQLRALGLPKKPLFTVSMKHTTMSFDGPEVVNIGKSFKS
jgi:hypothetical protein